MSILNVTIDLLSSSIIEIHGQVYFELLKEFDTDWMIDDFESFRKHFKNDSESSIIQSVSNSLSNSKYT